MRKLIVSILLTLTVIFPLQAAEMNHSGMDHKMGAMDSKGHLPTLLGTPLAGTSKTQAKVELQKLDVMPVSGKAREGGYDGRYVMDSTDVVNALPTRCAQASRGVVMMDNTDWTRCGGKPDGAAQDSQAVNDHAAVANEHAGHNM